MLTTIKRANALEIVTALILGATGVGTFFIVVYPTATVVVVLLGGVVALGLTRPKSYFAIAITTIFFAPSIARWTGQSALLQADEAFAVITLPLGLVWNLKARQSALRPSFPGLLFFIVAMIAGIASSYASSVPLEVAAAGLLLTGKAIIFGWAASQIGWTANDVSRSVKGVTAVIVFVSLCGIVNILAPALWHTITNTTNVASSRFGIPAVTGPFVHPAVYGRVTGALAIAIVAYRVVFGRTRLSTALLTLTSLGTLFSLRRKSIIALLFAATYTRARVARSSSLGVALIAVPLLLLIGWGQLSTVGSAVFGDYLSNESARTRITEDGAAIATADFPFGAGLGRFASATARDNYSPEYVQLNYEDTYGLGSREETDNYLTDTQWPALYGELGWIGAAAYAAGLFSIIVTQLRAYREAKLQNNQPFILVGLMGSGVTIFMLVESIAAPAFTSAPVYPWLFVLAGVCGSYCARTQSSVERIGIEE